MKLFRFWCDLDLKAGYRASYALVPAREIDDTTAYFEEIVAAVKRTDCAWVMSEGDVHQIEASPRLTENEIYNHRRRD